MKIYFVIKGLYNTGGMERVTSVVANALAARGYTIGIICLKKGSPFFPLNPSINIHYVETYFFRKKALQKIYAQTQPDIVVLVGSHRSIRNIPATKGISFITWEHFNAMTNVHPLHKYSRKLAVQHCAKIVTLTEQDAQNYQTFFNAQNTICIPNPITIEHISPSPLTEKCVLAVGRLASQKGFDLLLKAWALTQERRHGWKLKIVGNGNHQKKLQRLIVQLGLEDSASIHPATKDVGTLYQQASILTMSSRFEGLPLVLIEGMSAGLPIVSFDCPTGPREIIQHHKTGLLVPALNTKKLAEALDFMMQDESFRKTCASNALQEVKKFSIDAIIDRWEQLFKEIKPTV